MKNEAKCFKADYFSYISLVVAETIVKCEVLQIKGTNQKTVFDQWSKSKNISYSSEASKPIEIVMVMIVLAVMFTFLAVIIDNKISSAAIVKGYCMTLCFMKLYDDNYWLREMLGDMAEKFK
ncbi:MAG TPA: hypothetical protein DCM01_07765 [Dielma fastidiosa]|nr:hypothetical protein [Dielma fastidiosa]